MYMAAKLPTTCRAVAGSCRTNVSLCKLWIATTNVYSIVCLSALQKICMNTTEGLKRGDKQRGRYVKCLYCLIMSIYFELAIRIIQSCPTGTWNEKSIAQYRTHFQAAPLAATTFKWLAQADPLWDLITLYWPLAWWESSSNHIWT